MPVNPADDDDLSEDERFALAMVPHAKKAMDAVRDLLPPGTHFGVYVLVPAGDAENRVIAINTDRQVMLPAVAQWVLTLLERETQ